MLDRQAGAGKWPPMTDAARQADLCHTMEEVRHGVDQIDEQIVALLGQRFEYMKAAARIKQDQAAVRDEGRKRQVLSNVERMALVQGVPTGVVRSLYESLIEASIAFEHERFAAKANSRTATGPRAS